MEDVLTKTERYFVNNFLFFCFFRAADTQQTISGLEPKWGEKIDNV